MPTCTVLRQYGPTNQRRRVLFEYREDGGAVISRRLRILDGGVDAQTLGNTRMADEVARGGRKGRKQKIQLILDGATVNSVAAGTPERAALWAQLSKMAVREARNPGELSEAHRVRVATLVHGRTARQIETGLDSAAYTAAFITSDLLPVLASMKDPSPGLNLPKVKR